MTVINIEGVGNVSVASKFMSMSPDEQQAVVDHIKSVRGVSDAAPSVAARSDMTGSTPENAGALQAGLDQKAQQMQPPGYLGQANNEGMRAVSESLQSMNEAFNPSVRDRGSEGVLEGPLKTGKGVLSALGLPFSYPYAAASSLVANPMASAIHGVGDLLGSTNGPTQEQIYSDIRPGVETALSAAGPGRVPKMTIKAPNSQELRAAYEAVRNDPATKGAPVPIEDVKDLAIRAEQELLARGDRPTLGSAPRTFKEIDRLTPKGPPELTPQQRLQAEMNWEKPPEVPRVENATVDDLLAAKRAFGEIAKERQPFPSTAATPDAGASVNTIRKLDDLIETAAPGMKDANANYSAMMTADALDRRVAKAEMGADVTASGMNIGNKIRQQAFQVYQNPGAMRGLRPEEQEMIKAVAEGSAGRNVLRYVSHLLGGGGGLGAVVTGAEASRSPLGALGYLTAPLGYALKVMENRMTVNAANRVSEAVRLRSPLGKAIQSSAEKWNEAHAGAIAQPTSGNLSKFLIASRNLSNTMQGVGVSVSPAELFKSLQGPSAARAQGEQP